MEYDIIHHPESNRFVAEVEGHTAYVEYSLHDGALDILHTVVPSPVGGRGIASALVEKAYGYAAGQGLERLVTCPYAARWLEKHR